MSSDFLLLDYETRSRADLPKVGGLMYATDPSTEILMAGVARRGEKPRIFDDLASSLRGSERVVSWGDFDRLICFHVEGFTTDWIDAMALARYTGMPGGLDQFAAAMSIPVAKDPRGKRLINRYSLPQKDGSFLEMPPDDRKAMEDYCLQDVVLLDKAWSILQVLLPEWEKHCSAGYLATEAMNSRGVPVDRVAAGRALDLCRAQEKALVEECQKLCGLKPSQSIALAEYLGLADVRKQTLEEAHFDDPEKRRVQEIRLQHAKAATKKLIPMLEMSARSGRAHGCFVFNGAHTGRGSSRGIQLQNMVRAKTDESFFDALHDSSPIDNPLSKVRDNIRGFIAPPRGRSLVVADYSQVEARLVAWLADCKPMLSAFLDPKRDIYREFAAKAFSLPVDEIAKGSDERSFGKIVVLGAGYGAGGNALCAQAPGYGLDASPEFMDRLKDVYRETYAEVPQLWNRLNDAALSVVSRRVVGDMAVGPVRFRVNSRGSSLIVVLPSGRALRFLSPQIEEDRFGNPVVSVVTKHGRRTVWGGHWLENIAQAVASDLKTNTMTRCESNGLSTIMEVHDEVVLEADTNQAPSVLSLVLATMESAPAWLPAGLITAEGDVMARYSK